jgi:hypothetical protein
MDGDGFDDNTWSPQHDGLGGLEREEATQMLATPIQIESWFK